MKIIRATTIKTLKNSKGHSVTVHLEGFIAAQDFYDDRANPDSARPVWAVFSGTEDNMRGFTANLIGLGIPARLHVDGEEGEKGRIECPRSLGYKTSSFYDPEQRGAVALRVYLPAYAVTLAPLEEGEPIKFVKTTPTDWYQEQLDWLRQQPEVSRAIVEHGERIGIVEGGSSKYQRSQLSLPIKLNSAELLELIPHAAEVLELAMQVSHTTVIPTLAFAVQLYLAALSEGLFSLPHTAKSKQKDVQSDPDDRWFWARRRDMTSFECVGLNNIGFSHATLIGCARSQLDRLIDKQAMLYIAAGSDAVNNLPKPKQEQRLAPILTLETRRPREEGREPACAA